ncbi:Pyruvate/Phosphoenolpyruvate kinase-like domain-containing protein [Xylaria venustula]|nr:Pyruvate/Phosphoenolpyruvate kinase-like domain-containing protein [Xylaria venustula]
MKSANETIVTMLQIETRAGVENLDAICAVPGVDLVFIGPNDLAQSLLGYTPATGDEPEFVAAIQKIFSAFDSFFAIAFVRLSTVPGTSQSLVSSL